MATLITDLKYGGAPEIAALPQTKLIEILHDTASSTFAKAKACQRLAVIGDGAAVEPLASLLADAQLSHYARFGLEAIPGAPAAAALEAALSKTSGLLLVGVINSIGVRRDRNSLGPLAKLRSHPDAEVAKAAEAALARLRPPL